MVTRTGFVLAGGFIAALVSRTAAANDGTPPWIHELIQTDSTNVTVTVAIVDSGEPGIDQSYRVERDGPEGTLDVIDETKFEPADAVDTRGRCRDGGGETNCTATPDLCTDCDGDDIPECDTEWGWCETVYYFDVVDWCVPAGETTYGLYEAVIDTFQSEDSIVVEAWDEECVPPGTDTGTETHTGTGPDGGSDSGDDSGTDEGGDDDGESDSKGCSISSVGARGVSSVLMLLAGLILLVPPGRRLRGEASRRR